MDIAPNALLSGLVGVVVGQAILIVWEMVKPWLAKRSLRKVIAEECRFNLDILNEIKGGLIDHKGSFKRLSVDFFRIARTELAKVSEKPEIVRMITHVCIDIDLYNREAEYVFGGYERNRIFVGTVGAQPTYIRMEPELKNISPTIKAATLGVQNSLITLLGMVSHNNEEL